MFGAEHQQVFEQFIVENIFNLEDLNMGSFPKSAQTYWEADQEVRWRE